METFLIVTGIIANILSIIISGYAIYTIRMTLKDIIKNNIKKL